MVAGASLPAGTQLVDNVGELGLFGSAVGIDDLLTAAVFGGGSLALKDEVEAGEIGGNVARTAFIEPAIEAGEVAGRKIAVGEGRPRNILTTEFRRQETPSVL